MPGIVVALQGLDVDVEADDADDADTTNNQSDIILCSETPLVIFDRLTRIL